MTIADGSTASADEVLNLAGNSTTYISDVRVLGYAFQTEAQNRYAIIYDSDVTEFETVSADGWVAGFETLESSGEVDTGATTMMYDSLVGYFTATLLDTFATGTVNSAIWTTSGTVTEAGGKMILSGNGVASTARTQGSGPGFDARTADSTFICNVDTTIDSCVGTIKVTNGTTAVTVFTLHNYVEFVEIYFDVSAETARVRVKRDKKDEWSVWGATTDISSATSNWYVEFNITSGGSTALMEVFDTWYVKGAVTQVFQSHGYDHHQTATSPSGVITLDHGIFTANKELAGATATWSLSSDDGSNFSTLNENEVTTIGTPSYQLVLKASIVSAADRPAYIYEFGVKAWD